MKNRHFLLLALLFLTACKQSIIGEGPLVKQVRTIGEFNELELDMSAKVTFIVADSFYMGIAAQENLLDNIKTNLQGEKLEISSRHGFTTNKPIEIIMTLPSLKAITVNSSGEVIGINTLHGDNLDLKIVGSGDIKLNLDMKKTDIRINGSGDVKLKGTSLTAITQINGSGNLEAEELITEKTKIAINGSGDAAVHATGKLNAKIIGSGDIIYSGEPTVITEITGSGDVKKR